MSIGRISIPRKQAAQRTLCAHCWLDEDNPGAISLLQLVRIPGKTNSSDDAAVRYNDNDDWAAHAPVWMYFKYGLVDQFMKEWLLRKQELKAGGITRVEYFEWKLGFPQTCDNCGKQEPSVQWKEKREDK